MKIYKYFARISNNFKLVCATAFMGVVLLYFLFHAINGENGLLSYIQIKRQSAMQAEKLKSLKEDFEVLKRRVALLSNDSLDLDLLEERCRIILNYCNPEDIIVKE
ncbi:MAG: septum formation initiator family protein [Holosporales bacterium]|jgi:cell division protein FtsB|nr:septum formation initiator family protein [Holosporales bacterium]